MTTLRFLKARIEASNLDEGEKKKALRNLFRSTPDETDILYGVFETKEAWRFAGEILKGAHVRIFDFGARYDHWKTLPSARTRRSSHASDGPQYHVNGVLVSTVLFGKIGSWTWLQLEGHPQGIGHIIDWIKYSITGENQGPYGSSSHVENRPVRLTSPTQHVVHKRPDWAKKVKLNPRGKTFQ